LESAGGGRNSSSLLLFIEQMEEKTKSKLHLNQYLDYDENFSQKYLDSRDCDTFKYLKEQINWRQDEIFLFGRNHQVPRLHAWYADHGANYQYSKIGLPRNDWTNELLEIKAGAEKVAGVTFNGVLLNLYRDGSDSNGWHADDEPELIKPVVVAGVSFGAERAIKFRKKGESKMCHQQILKGGSLIVMREGVQDGWQHSIAKKAQSLMRINLTFRQIKL